MQSREGRDSTAFSAAIALQDVRDSFAAQGAFVAPGTPQAFLDLVRADMEKWREVVKAAEMRPD